jgi:hypothetical protein
MMVYVTQGIKSKNVARLLPRFFGKLSLLTAYLHFWLHSMEGCCLEAGRPFIPFPIWRRYKASIDHIHRPQDAMFAPMLGVASLLRPLSRRASPASFDLIVIRSLHRQIPTIHSTSLQRYAYQRLAQNPHGAGFLRSSAFHSQATRYLTTKVSPSLKAQSGHKNEEWQKVKRRLEGKIRFLKCTSWVLFGFVIILASSWAFERFKRIEANAGRVFLKNKPAAERLLTILSRNPRSRRRPQEWLDDIHALQLVLATVVLFPTLQVRELNPQSRSERVQFALQFAYLLKGENEPVEILEEHFQALHALQRYLDDVEKSIMELQSRGDAGRSIRWPDDSHALFPLLRAFSTTRISQKSPTTSEFSISWEDRGHTHWR